MPAIQKLLFPDPCPLVETLGRDFFLGLPQSPGVYLMRESSDVVLYVGKAKNLRNRLSSYRVANPDRRPRRQLRLLRAVARIEIEQTADERSALARESQLLRALRPRFNRAGTWTAPPKFLSFRAAEQELELRIVSTPGAEWPVHGPLAAARELRNAIARLLFLALHPKGGMAQLPLGWFRGRSQDSLIVRFAAGKQIAPVEVSAQLSALFAGQPECFLEWILTRLTADLSLFENAVVEEDLLFLMERFSTSSAAT